MVSTANRLNEALAIRRMRPVDLSKASNISRGALSQYLSGKVIPKQDKISILANALMVSPAWLMGYDVDMQDNSCTLKKEKLYDDSDFPSDLVNMFKKLDSKRQKKVVDFLYNEYKEFTEEKEKAFKKDLKQMEIKYGIPEGTLDRLVAEEPTISFSITYKDK